MTYNEITCFRRFMTNKGVLNNFEYLFQHHGFEGKDIDQYYEDADAEFVIMTAFDFSKCDRTIFNYAYWEKIDTKWQRTLKEYREEGKMINPPEIRCAKCGKMKPITEFHLGKNLVPHKNCKMCETKLIARKVANSSTTEGIFKICDHCGKKKNIEDFPEKKESPDGHSNYCKDCMREAQRLKYNPTTEENTNMEDFTFFDFDEGSKIRERKIEKGQMAINYKTKNAYATMSREDTDDIANAGLDKVRIRVDNITGAMHLVFNKEKGATVTLKNKKNATMSNQKMVEFLLEKLRLEKKDGTRYLIDIGCNLSNVDGVITYNILKGK